MILATFSLQILSPNEAPAEEGSAYALERQDMGVLMNLPRFIVETEENLADLLPDGYSVKIREWDSEEV